MEKAYNCLICGEEENGFKYMVKKKFCKKCLDDRYPEGYYVNKYECVICKKKWLTFQSKNCRICIVPPIKCNEC